MLRWWPLLLLLTACGEDSQMPSSTPPPAFAAILYPADNASTGAGIALGKTLFFDPALSEDGRISCATCHRPELAFSDGLPVSRGVNDLPGTRNTPGLANIGYFHQPLFWDGRADNLEAQALHPIGSAHEMGGSWPAVIAYLHTQPAYVTAFREAFAGQPIDATRVGRALAQYQRTLVSANSKYDRVQRGEATFTAQEALGNAIFFDYGDDITTEFAGLPKGECAHCHTPPHFTNQRYENNGLDEVTDLTAFTDPGRGAITGQVYDNGRFRNPGLRNVALTAPYMHDGRFTTLEEVVDHYNTGGKYAENRSPNVHPLGLDTAQKAALVAFLHTLTDTSFVIQGAGTQVQRSSK